MKNCSTSNLRLPFLPGLAILIFLSLAILQAQDDPRYDNTVGILPPEGISPSPTPRSLQVITSEEGFDNFDLGVDFAEPHISSNPLNPRQFFTAFNINGAHYSNNGHDWTSLTPPFPGFSVRGDPVTAYDSLGNLYYMSMFGSGIQGAKVIRSGNNGQTWSPPVTAVSGFDKCWMAADQTMGPYANYVYAVMTGGAGGNFSRSVDLGTTWQNTFSASSQSLPGMMVAVGANVLGGNNISGGCVYIATNGGSTTAPTYTFYRSTDGGATFSFMSAVNFAGFVGTFVNGRHSVQNSRTRPYPFIAADNSFGPFRGRLYLVYASNTPAGSGNKPDIFSHFSDDQGATWSSAVVINDDPNTQNNHQWTPAIWCDKETGRLYAKWYDTRDVPTSDSTGVYASYSDDGGVTWALNQKLTTAVARINCTSCGGGTPRYQGDYDAITSNRYAAMAVWTDFRNGNFGSFTAYFPDFAMLAATKNDTIGPNDSTEIVIKIPAVKLYSHTAKFSATVSPPANFTLTFPQGDSLTAYPDSLILKVKTANVPIGDYTVTITGQGPNGTPVHRRDVNISILGSFVAVVQPNGGEAIFSRSNFSIKWTKNQVDTVRIEYSLDGGSSWRIVTPGTAGKTSGVIHPKQRNKTIPIETNPSADGIFSWTTPDTLSDSCLVRITAKDDSIVVDVSDGFFSLVPPPAALWRNKTSGSNKNFYAVSLVDTLVAWTAGENGVVYRTLNGGNSWQQRIPVFNDIYSIFAHDGDRAFTASNGAGNVRIFRTTNGGSTWKTVFSDTSSSAFINHVTMFDDLNGYAMGDPVNGQWTLLSTADSGNTWQQAAVLSQAGTEAGWNNSMSWVGGQYGWFGTNNNRVYATTDSGATWNFAPTTFANSFTVSFVTDLLGMAGGSTTANSVDGGLTWLNTTGQLPGSTFASATLDQPQNRWYFVSGTEIYRTDDQGGSYQLEFGQSSAYQHVSMKIVNIEGNDWICGYAVGDQGTITKYVELITATGIVNTDDLNPKQFSLGQNYPNPFNPTTTIFYRVPVQSKVTIKIFNILGQEVIKLVDKSHNPGKFNVKWNGQNSNGVQVSSGVYFYRLVSEKQFVQTRKMLLVR